MTGLDTPFSAPFLILSVILLVAVLAVTYWRLQGMLRPAYLNMLAGLRGFALMCLLLVLFNPYTVRMEPDSDGFRVAVLADASGSMEIRDVTNGTMSRLELIGDWIGNSGGVRGPLAALEDRDYRTDSYRFGEELASLRSESGTPGLMPGQTALGDVLFEVLDRSDAEREHLGAVLLLSDGGHNTGRSPVEAARRLRDRGIPVTVVGVGAHDPPGRIDASFASSRVRGERGEPVSLPVTLSNTRDADADMRLTLSDHTGVVLEQREVRVAAGREARDEVFQITPLEAGERLYRLSVTESNGEENNPEKTDYAFVRAEDPETLSVLYLGNRLGMEYRFIARGIDDSDQIALESVIRTGPHAFYHEVSEETEGLLPQNAFPESSEFLNRFDAILADTRVLPELSEEGWENLADFASVRGGGMLFFGPLEGVPRPIANVLPVIEAESRVLYDRTRLDVEAAPVFNHLSGGQLFGRPSPFFGEDTYAVVIREAKPGARPVLRREGANEVLMAAQAFGAGRVAYLGSENTWQWRMDSEAGMNQHRLFWENLLVWLGSTGKARLTVSAQGERYTVGESFNLEADVLGSDFRPSRDATVSVEITDPSGESWERLLQPSFDVPGRYRTSFTPGESGEYHARYRIELPGGEVLEQNAFFLALPHGAEMEDTRYREDVLRDIARITGGDFYHYANADRMTALPLSREIPVRESRAYVANQGWFLVLFLLALMAEWFFRRRVGLK